MKSGGGNYSAPDQPQPNAAVTPYGQASPFTPQYDSVLNSSDPNRPAQLSDPSQLEYGGITPLQQQQEAIIAAKALEPAAAPEMSARDKFVRMIIAEQEARKGAHRGVGGMSHGDRGASYGGRSGSGGLY